MVVKAFLELDHVSSSAKAAWDLLEKQGFGERHEDSVSYSFFEALYLVEEKKMQVLDAREKELSKKVLQERFRKKDKQFEKKYAVFRDLRKKGYVVKSALKFGAEFRVYEPGKKGQHSRWVLVPLQSTERLSLQDFAAKNRVAHSIKKKLLLALADDERAITYYEVSWIKL